MPKSKNTILNHSGHLKSLLKLNFS